MPIYNFKLAGIIRDQALAAVSSAPTVGPKDVYVEQCFDLLLNDYDWSISFSTPVAIIYDDVITSEILVILHRWLRRKCADVENIHLITTHHIGISDWWNSWCQINHEKSFQITELFFTAALAAKKYFKNFIELPKIDFYKKNKKISKMFSFYGGTYATLEREYLILKMLEFKDSASIDFFAKFSPKNNILDYVEQITYYKNQKECDYISRAYNIHIDNYYLNSEQNISRVKDETINFNGYQWSIDKNCWASVIRETINDSQFCTLTEKTLRAFLHHTVVIPIGVNSVSNLENLGFWFPRDIIDYSYEREPIFSNRVNQISKMLTELINTYSYDQLENYYAKNLQKFQHNAALVYNYINQHSKLYEMPFKDYYEKNILHGQ